MKEYVKGLVAFRRQSDEQTVVIPVDTLGVTDEEYDAILNTDPNNPVQAIIKIVRDEDGNLKAELGRILLATNDAIA